MENQMMTALTDIIIEGVGSYQSILSLKINTAANEHGMFICRLRLEEDEIFVNEEDRTGNRILVRDKKDIKKPEYWKQEKLLAFRFSEIWQLATLTRWDHVYSQIWQCTFS